jgi:tetratricopeptide (TPR) repeat protein/SAM-dependent methyltransferase
MNELEQARALFMRALQHHNAGRLAEAEPLYREALVLVPDRASVLVNLAVVLVGLGRHGEAEPLAARAVALDPGDAQAAAVVAECRRALDGPGAALAALDSALARRPDDADAHTQRGVLLQAAGDRDAALAAFDTALRHQPRHLPALVNRAATHAAAGAVDAALADYRTALAIDPDYAPAGQGWIHLVLDSGRIPVGADAAFDALLCRALLMPWVRPAMLGRLVARRLAQDPRIAAALARADAAWPAPPVVADEEIAAWCAPLAGAPLLSAWLTTCSITDPRLEAVLVATRRCLSRLATEAGVAAAYAHPLALHVAIAQQCGLCEHAWTVDGAEQVALAPLVDRLAALLDAGQDPPAALVATVASYMPLIDIAGAARLLARPCDPLLAPLLARQIAEPLADRVAAPRVAMLTAVVDATSRAVAAQYEVNPYPRWTALARPAARIVLSDYVSNRLGAASPVNLPRGGPVRILHAGCGTGEAPIDTALRIAGAEVLAIDLSRASLAYAQRMAVAHAADNIRFGCADLLELGALRLRFDLIESAGVLHHLADPAAGLGVLAGLLAPHGLMRLVVYSDAARSAVVAARALIAAHGLGADADGMRRARALIASLPVGHAARAVMDYSDFYALSECRDLLFHVSEQRCTLPQLAGWLERAGLAFLGFELAPAWRRAFAAEHATAAARTDLAAWTAFEARHPDAFTHMYTFWVMRRA